jgi:hypothetical protein
MFYNLQGELVTNCFKNRYTLQVSLQSCCHIVNIAVGSLCWVKRVGLGTEKQLKKPNYKT